VRIVYGDLVIDTDRLVITSAGVDVHVQPQVFDVLSHLLVNRDRVVTKEELLDEIWGDRFVSESALTSRIKSARQLVGDDGVSQRAIKTVHGRGYRWIADVQVEVDLDLHTAIDEPSSVSSTYAPPITPPPRPLVELVGRQREVEGIHAASGKHRFVTLIGPPGVGKSRLAVEVAVDSAERGDIEVGFVDLRPASGRSDVLAAFRSSVHVADAARSAEPNADQHHDVAVDALVDHLRRRRVLLVIDNCEHLIEHVAGLCRTLLRSCPDVRFLATSRQRLGLEGEFVVVIEPLPLPDTDTTTWEQLRSSDAGRLFVDRSHAAGAHWEETREQVALASALCRRLDGLPLAIELAAARTRWMSLHDLVLQFTDEFERGPAGDSTGGPLQIALRSSRSRLSVDERHAFDALSVFASSFTIDAALFVIGTVCPHGDALAIFETLIDHSLVDVISGRRHRYRLLETVQRYADACRVASDDAGLAMRAHFDHYLRFVEKRWPVGSISTTHPWTVLTAEKTEIHAAIRRAAVDDPRSARHLIGALGWYWWIDGDSRLWDDLGPVLDPTVADDPDHIAAPFAWTQAISRVLLGLDPVPFALDAVERARRAEQWSVAAWAVAFSVAPDMMWIDLAPVSERWDEIVELFRRNGDACGEGWAMVYILGYAQACAHQHDDAAATYGAAAAIFERCGDQLGRCRALLEIVELNIWTGDNAARARAVYDTIPHVDDLPIESWMKLQWLGGLIAEAEGDLDLAVQLHIRALETSERHLPAALLTNTYRCLTASSLRRAGRHSESADLFLDVMGFVVRRASLPGWNRHAPWVLESIAGLLVDAGRPATAVELVAAAGRLRDDLDAPMPYWDHRRGAPDMERARATLGDESFATAVATGRGRDLDATTAIITAELAALRRSTTGTDHSDGMPHG
jgi:predicted ATPase/DNA-binding winged helix-turn-helix (wHTH) protein